MIKWKRVYEQDLNDRYRERTSINGAGYLFIQLYFENGVVNLKAQQLPLCLYLSLSLLSNNNHDKFEKLKIQN